MVSFVPLAKRVTGARRVPPAPERRSGAGGRVQLRANESLNIRCTGEGGGEVAGKTIVYCLAEAVIVMSFVTAGC